MALKEGKNRKRLSTAMLVEFVKKSGKVISTKIQNKNGAWTGNIINANTATLGFTCTNDHCICIGDNNCNDMISSDVCKII